MTDCLFCKIVAGEIPAARVYEDEGVLAFLDINPVSPGHTLVIPKKHFPNLYGTPDEVISKIFVVAKKIALGIKTAMNTDGTNLQTNNDPAAGQVIPHTHIHIIPRYEKDGLKLWPQKEYPEGEKDKVAGKIRSAIL